jgi:hypothetical protein
MCGLKLRRRSYVHDAARTTTLKNGRKGGDRNGGARGLVRSWSLDGFSGDWR